MSLIGNRSEYNEDVIAFPSSKTAAAVTLSSGMLWPFERRSSSIDSGEGSWGGARVVLHGDSMLNVGDTVKLQPYVTFDKGDSNWLVVGDTIVSGGITSPMYMHVPFAPRLKVDAVFDSQATLAASHGLQVDVEFYEHNAEDQRYVGRNIVSSLSQAAGDSLTGGTTATGDTIEVNTPRTLYLWMRGDSGGEITGDTFTTTLYSSNNAEDWWSVKVLTQIDLASSLSAPFNVVETVLPSGDSYLLDGPVGKYVRLDVAAAAQSSITRIDNTIRFYLLATK